MLKFCTTTLLDLHGHNDHLHDLLNNFNHHNRKSPIDKILFTTAITATSNDLCEYDAIHNEANLHRKEVVFHQKNDKDLILIW